MLVIGCCFIVCKTDENLVPIVVSLLILLLYVVSNFSVADVIFPAL